MAKHDACHYFYLRISGSFFASLRRKICVTTIIKVGHLKLLIITGSNQYGVVSHFMQGMRAELGSLNINIFELAVGSQETVKNSVKKNVQILSYFDFVVSFNAVGLDSVIQERSIIE